MITSLFRNARDEARLDRQFGGSERQGFFRGLHGDAVDFENHAARLDPCHPQFRRALAGAHPHFGGLLRHRHVRENPDPDPAGALHVTGQRAARGFDLTRGDALGRHRLQAELTERQRRARSRGTVDPALMRLPELRFLWLHHGLRPQTFYFALSSVAARPGIVAFGHLLVLGHRVVLKDFALEDPDLDAAGAERGERGRHPVIDVGAQRVQRHATFAIPFHARDFGAAETARAVDTNALGAQTHRRLHRALHGAAERDAALQLLGDRFGNQRGVELRLADLDDIDDDVGGGDIGNPLAQLVDVRALLADHDAGTRRVDRHPALLVRTLDHDSGDGCLLQFLVQHLADFDILVQQLAVLVLAGEPTRIPRPVDAETQSDWIDFLTHRSLLRRLGASLGFDLTNNDRQLREWAKYTARTATAARCETLHHDAVADMRLSHDQLVDVEVVIVLGVGDRRFQALLDVDRDPLARKLQVGERSRCLPAADQLRDQIKLLRADPQHPGDRLGLVVREGPFALWFAHRFVLKPSWLSCRQNGRGRSVSARTRRTCDRPFPR